MPVTHAFTSAKSDGADGTLIQPSNWNAAHVVTPDALDVLQYVREEFIGNPTLTSGVYIGAQEAVYTLLNVNGTGSLGIGSGAYSGTLPPGWQLSSGATSGNESCLFSGYSTCRCPAPSSTSRRVRFRFQLGSVVNSYYEIGISQNQNATSGDLTNRTGIWCSVTNTASAGTWHCLSQYFSGGFHTTDVTTSPAQTADTSAHIITITYNTSSITFDFDGTTVATISTNLANTALTPVISAKTSETAAKSIIWYAWDFTP